MIYRIRPEKLKELNEASSPTFPKYTSQIINWANQNAQGTRSKMVGQMSGLFPEYLQESTAPSIEGWWDWYTERYPTAIEVAAKRIFDQVQNLREAIKLIDYEMVRSWVEDLIITKTYMGLYVQKAILAFLAEERQTTYRMATPAEEAQGIDGFVGETAYSIKPESYRSVENVLPEELQATMIYYKEPAGKGLTIDVDE